MQPLTRVLPLIAMLPLLVAPLRSHAQTIAVAAATAHLSTQSTFQTGPCPPNLFPTFVRVDCGFLTVPENRARPGSRTIQVAAAIVHAPTATPKPDPIVFLEGGPSIGAIGSFA